MTHGNVAVDRQQDRQPSVRQPDEVHHRIQVDEHLREHGDVGSERLRQRVQRRQTAHEQGEDENEAVGDGERLEQHCRREAVLLLGEDGEGDDVCDDSNDGDRHRDAHFAHEPEQRQLIVVRRSETQAGIRH